MKKTYFASAIVLLMILMALTGCSKKKSDKFEPTQTCLYIRDNGTLASGEIVEFSKDYYNLEELKAFVEKQVSAYNEEKAGIASAYADDSDKDAEKLPAAVSSLTEEDGKVTLIIDYASGEDYVGLNKTEVAEGGLKQISTATVKEILDSGKTVEGIYQDEKGEAVDQETIQKKTKYHVVTVEGNTLLKVQGTVKYVSEGVTITDDDMVETPAGQISYIIYK